MQKHVIFYTHSIAASFVADCRESASSAHSHAENVIKVESAFVESGRRQYRSLMSQRVVVFIVIPPGSAYLFAPGQISISTEFHLDNTKTFWTAPAISP
jgi:hypothetical protein